jgi:hypothetical protein
MRWIELIFGLQNIVHTRVEIWDFREAKGLNGRPKIMSYGYYEQSAPFLWDEPDSV